MATFRNVENVDVRTKIHGWLTGILYSDAFFVPSRQATDVLILGVEQNCINKENKIIPVPERNVRNMNVLVA